MAAWVGYVIYLDDDPFGVDQEADSLRKIGELLRRVAENFVAATDALVGIAQKRKRKVARGLERQIVGRGVERNADDRTVGLFKLRSLITQALCLDRSTRGACFGVPPQQRPAASAVV